MVFDELLVLGRTVPENSKKYGERVCMAGFDLELRQLVRVYPLQIHNQFKTGSIYKNVAVRRNNEDSRRESWRLKESASPTEIRCLQPATRIEVLDDEYEGVKTIAEANSERASLALVTPTEALPVVFKQKKEFVSQGQRLLFEGSHRREDRSGFMVASDYSRLPYIPFRLDQSEHSLQVREWGCFELIRKKNVSASQLTSTLKYLDQDRQRRFLVGNMAQHRNVWLIISVLTAKVDKTLF